MLFSASLATSAVAGVSVEALVITSVVSVLSFSVVVSFCPASASVGVDVFSASAVVDISSVSAAVDVVSDSVILGIVSDSPALFEPQASRLKEIVAVISMEIIRFFICIILIFHLGIIIKDHNQIVAENRDMATGFFWFRCKMNPAMI